VERRFSDVDREWQFQGGIEGNYKFKKKKIKNLFFIFPIIKKK
jgi:hypothetical protein